MAEVIPSGVAINKASGYDEAGMIVYGEQQGLFLCVGPPLVDGGVVLPEFSKAGTAKATVGTRFALGSGD